MKIGFITASVSRQAGGLFESVRRLAQSLQAAGNSVSVYAAQDSNSTIDARRWAPLEVHTFPTRGPARFSFAPEITDAVCSADLDIVMSHGLWRYTSIATSSWHRKRGKNYVVNPHGMLDAWAVRNSRWRKIAAAGLFERKHLIEARCIRALCAAEAASIREYGCRNPIAIIPNGIDMPAQADSDVASPWSAMDQFAGKKVLFSLGRLHPKKNLLNLVHAWKRMADTEAAIMGDWRLVIGGWDDGGYAQQLKACVRDLNLSPQVHLLGPLFGPEKDAAFRDASAFVLPSLSEGLPMVVLEAWSHSLPVLMTPECNLPAGFETGAALRMETNTASIAEGLRRLFTMSDPDRAAMGKRGRQLCADVFNWEQIGAQTHALLEWVAGTGPEPGFVTR